MTTSLLPRVEEQQAREFLDKIVRLNPNSELLLEKLHAHYVDFSTGVLSIPPMSKRVFFNQFKAVYREEVRARKVIIKSGGKTALLGIELSTD